MLKLPKTGLGPKDFVCCRESGRRRVLSNLLDWERRNFSGGFLLSSAHSFLLFSSSCISSSSSLSSSSSQYLSPPPFYLKFFNTASVAGIFHTIIFRGESF